MQKWALHLLAVLAKEYAVFVFKNVSKITEGKK